MYRSRLKADLERWQRIGLVGPSAAEAMLADVDRRRRVFRPADVLAVLAAVLLGGAVILLVAANWQEIPRWVRVLFVVAMIWIGYAGAAIFARRNRPGIADGLLVFAAMSFGAGIGLVGQMYHLPGNLGDAVLLWFAGTLVAAVLFAAPVLVHMSVLLSWLAFGALLTDDFGVLADRSLHAPPILALLLVIGIRISGARRAGHGVCLLLIAWLVRLYAEWDVAGTALAIVVLGAVLFVAFAERRSPFFAVAEREGQWPAFYGLVTAYTGLAVMQIHHWDSDWPGQIGVAAAVLILSVAALLVIDREFTAVRRLIYTAFSAEVLYLALTTVGTLLGTSAVFLAGGVLLAAMAFAVTRIERRFASGQGGA